MSSETEFDTSMQINADSTIGSVYVARCSVARTWRYVRRGRDRGGTTATYLRPAPRPRGPMPGIPPIAASRSIEAASEPAPRPRGGGRGAALDAMVDDEEEVRAAVAREPAGPPHRPAASACCSSAAAARAAAGPPTPGLSPERRLLLLLLLRTTGC